MRRPNLTVISETELTKEEIEEYQKKGYELLGYGHPYSKYYYYFKKINELPGNNK